MSVGFIMLLPVFAVKVVDSEKKPDSGNADYQGNMRFSLNKSFQLCEGKLIVSIVNTLFATQQPALCRLTPVHAVLLSGCSTLSRLLSPARSSSTEAAKAIRTVTALPRNACPIVLGKMVRVEFIWS